MVSTVGLNSPWIFFSKDTLIASFKSHFLVSWLVTCPDSSCFLICLLNISMYRYFCREILHHFFFVSCSAVQSSEQNSACLHPPQWPHQTQKTVIQCKTVYQYRWSPSAWSGKYIHVGARAGWQVAPAQHSWQWILVRLSAECEPTGSVLRAEATDLECVKDASRTTLHSSQKLPSNQMARRRVAFPVRDVAPPPWYQTTCYHFNIFQQQSPWVLLGAHEIQECFHVLGRLSSTETAVLCNMWQVPNTFSQSGPSNIDQVSRCRSENQWIQIRSSTFCIFALITTPNVLETSPLTRVEQDRIFSPRLARKITNLTLTLQKRFRVRSLSDRQTQSQES